MDQAHRYPHFTKYQAVIQRPNPVSALIKPLRVMQLHGWLTKHLSDWQQHLKAAYTLFPSGLVKTTQLPNVIWANRSDQRVVCLLRSLSSWFNYQPQRSQHYKLAQEKIPNVQGFLWIYAIIFSCFYFRRYLWLPLKSPFGWRLTKPGLLHGPHTKNKQMGLLVFFPASLLWCLLQSIDFSIVITFSLPASL